MKVKRNLSFFQFQSYNMRLSSVQYYLNQTLNGSLAERLNATVLKTVEG